MNISPEGSSAVLCRNATLSYGRESSKNRPVLNRLNLQLDKGTIYGLLGPSGCGKTTLLKCILGNLRLNFGQVWVFGQTTPTFGTHGIHVPGKDVGYMPQDLALHPNFKIKEIFYFYGKINGMTFAQTREKMNFIADLLALPSPERMVDQLSGGQKRRVSFGVALIHDPMLLILDEPTVGVDPVLRSKIWHHLVTLSKFKQTSILITTHYIEEARQANRVGLMRNGVLLSEGDPELLIQQRGSPSLEAVFLELCSTDNENDNPLPETSDHDDKEMLIQNEKHSENLQSYNIPGTSNPVTSSVLNSVSSSFSERVQDFFKESLPNPKHLAACTLKDSIILIRNKPLMVFQFLLPFIQISILLLAIGGNPKNVPVGVFNEDSGLGTFSLSEKYLKYLDTGDLIELHYYSFLEDAQNDAHNAKISALVHFGENYTVDLMKRGMGYENVSVDVALGGSVFISLDQTVLLTAMLLQEKFLEAYAEFALNLVQSMDTNPSLTILPINFTQPFYGAQVKTFTDYMAPGVILQLTYAMSVSLTGIGAIIERKLGLVDRLSASGVTETILMLSLMIVQCFIMTGQIAILFIMALLVFNTPFLGSLALAVLIAYLQGISGLVFGLIVSAVCTEETQAMQLALGTFYPIMLLSGVIWPLNAIPYPLNYVSYFLPPTLPAAAMRDVFLRGWGVSYREVWEGLLVNVMFIVLFLSIAIAVRKILWYRR